MIVPHTPFTPEKNKLQMTTEPFKITPELITKIHQILDEGLVKGLGKPNPGAMCVEAAICFALGEPHSDKPSCVSNTLRVLKYRINDLRWSSPQTRANGLRRLAIAQLGTKDNFNEKEFIESVICILLKNIPNQTMLPQIWLAWRKDYLENKNRNNKAAAKAAANAAYAPANAAYDIAYAAYAAYAADNAAINAVANAAAYAASAAAYAASAATYDKFLSDFCEEIVQILIKMETPGSKWLDFKP